MKRKNIRLPHTTYLGQRMYFVTACCRERRPVFRSPQWAVWLIDTVREESARAAFLVHAFCVMPDHVHLLVEGTSGTSDLLAFMRRWKQRTAFEYKQRSGVALWQMKFYDHIVRPQETPGDVAAYIWTNPLRKGLCQQIEAYPFVGTFTMPWPPGKAAQTTWKPPWKQKP